MHTRIGTQVSGVVSMLALVRRLSVDTCDASTALRNASYVIVKRTQSVFTRGDLGGMPLGEFGFLRLFLTQFWGKIELRDLLARICALFLRKILN